MAQHTFHHLGLTFRCDHYYLKRSRIVEKIVFQNRTFYAKFERIDTHPTALLLQQHLRGDYTVAIPLLHNGKTDYIVFEYKGEEASRFGTFMYRLLQTKRADMPCRVFFGKTKEKVQVFLRVRTLSVEEASLFVEELSGWITQRYGNDWHALPSSTLPEAYNIVTLPYAVHTA